jgi:hypothetical protein
MPETRDDDLDEYALERTRLEDELPGEGLPGRAAPGPGGRLFPVVLAGGALLALGALALLFATLRRAPAAATAAATPPAAAAAARAATAAQPPPSAAPLPGLDESDDFVRRAAAALSTHPEVARWLGQPGLVRVATAVVTNVVDGDSPRPHLGFLAPKQGFRARGSGGRAIADPAGFVGYDRFVDAVASVDAASAVAAYSQLEPLFEAAFRDLGHPEGGFRQELGRAITILLATPVSAPDARLLPAGLGFRYADSRFEQLTPAQKQFLRLGPRNVTRLHAKLRELQALLGPSLSPEPPR